MAPGRGEDKGKTETLRCPMHGRAVHRASPTGRGPGANAAAFPLYIRAGKVRVEREMGPLLASWGVSFTTLTLPPPLFCVCSIWCLCLCAACLCLCDSVRRTLRPPRCVSTGPVRLCVLPGWQINVNVNVVSSHRV